MFNFGTLVSQAKLVGENYSAMKLRIHNYILVLLSAALFFTFSMMHEFDWLIPVSPVVVMAGMSSVPATDIAEESSSEDEIEHEESFYIHNYAGIKYFKSLDLKIEFIVSKVLSPPPDMV